MLKLCYFACILKLCLYLCMVRFKEVKMTSIYILYFEKLPNIFNSHEISSIFYQADFGVRLNTRCTFFHLFHN